MRTTRALTTSATMLIGAALLAVVTGCSIPSITIGGAPQTTPAGSGSGSGSGSGGGAAATTAEDDAAGGGSGSDDGSGGSGDEAGGDPMDVPRELACELLTKQEAEKTIGMPLDEGVASGGGTDGALCTWTADPSGPVGQVEVVTGPGAEKVYEIDVELGHEFEAVDGLGDEAHYEYNMIFFRKGDQWAAVRLVSLSDTDFKQSLVDAAQLVHDRI